MTAQDQLSVHHGVTPYTGLAPYMVKAPTMIHAWIEKREKPSTLPQGFTGNTSTLSHRSSQQDQRSTRPRIEYQGDSPIPVYKAPHLWDLPASVKQQWPASFAS